VTSLIEAAQALREAAVVRVSLLSAYHAGDVVIVECTRALTAESMRKVREMVENILTDTGIKLIVLPEGMRVVGREDHTTVPPV
jgi:predicted ATP-grasp superfamily ATP-dependent carboligase